MKTTLLITLSLVTLMAVAAQEEKPKPRVFITHSHSWEMSGGFTATQDVASGSFGGGARPQTAEIIKTFGEKCTDVTVTLKQGSADYIVLMEHEGGKGIIRKDNKYALFNKDGDAIKSGSSRTVGGAVKDACAALIKDWKPTLEKPE